MGLTDVRAYGSRGRIGILVPSVNTVLEPEFNQMSIDGVSIHSARLTLTGQEVPEDTGVPKALIAMAEGVEVAAKQLQFPCDVIAYGCTVGSFARGVVWDKRLIDRISMASGKAATTTSTALVKALRILGVRRVAVVTPYIEESNILFQRYMEESGFSVEALVGLGMYKAGGPAQVTTDVLFELSTRAVTSNTECLVLACTDMPTINTIEVLEKEFSVPVLSSNQVTYWHCLALLGVSDNVLGYGRLLSEQGQRVP